MQDRQRDSGHVYYKSFKTPNKTCSNNPCVFSISRKSNSKCTYNITETDSSQAETSISNSHENDVDSNESVFTKGVGSSNTLISIVQNDGSQHSFRDSGQESVLEGIVNIIDDVLNTKSDHRFRVTLELDKNRSGKRKDLSNETVYDKLQPYYGVDNYVYYNTGVAEKKHKTPPSCRCKNVCYHSVEMNVLQLTGFNQHSKPPVELHLSPMAYAERSIISECNIRKQSKRENNRLNCSQEVKSLAINNLEKLVEFILRKVEEQNNCGEKCSPKNDVMTNRNNVQCRYQQTDKKIANLKKSANKSANKLNREPNKSYSSKGDKSCECLNNYFHSKCLALKDSHCRPIRNDNVIVTNVLSHLEEIESHFVSVKHLINKAVTKGIVENLRSLPIKKLKLKKIPQIKSLPSRFCSHYRSQFKSKLVSVKNSRLQSKRNVRNIPQESSHQSSQNSYSKLEMSISPSLIDNEKRNATNLQAESIYSSSESEMSENSTTTIENHECKLSTACPKPESDQHKIDNRLKNWRIGKKRSRRNGRQCKIKSYNKQTCEKCFRSKEKQTDEKNFGYAQADLVGSKSEEPVENNTLMLSTSSLDIKTGNLQPVRLKNGFRKELQSPNKKNVAVNLFEIENKLETLTRTANSTKSLDSKNMQYIVGSAYDNIDPRNEEKYNESSVCDDSTMDVKKNQFTNDELFATVLGLESLSVLTDKENVIVERLQAAIEKLEDMQLIVGIKAALASIYGLNQQLQDNTNNSNNANVGICSLPRNGKNSNVTSIPPMLSPKTQIISEPIKKEGKVKKDHAVHQTNEEIVSNPVKEERRVTKNDTLHRKPNEVIIPNKTKLDRKIKKNQIVLDKAIRKIYRNQTKEESKGKTGRIVHRETNKEIIPSQTKGERKVKRDPNVHDISIREIFGNDANEARKIPKDHIVQHMTNENTIREEIKKEEIIKSDPKHQISNNLNSDKKENIIEKYASLRPKLIDLQEGNETESDLGTTTTASTSGLDMKDVSCGASFFSGPCKSGTSFEQSYCIASVSTEKIIPTKTNSNTENRTDVHSVGQSKESSLSLVMMKPHMKNTWARITENLETIVPMNDTTQNKVRLPLGMDLPNGSYPNFKDLDKLWMLERMHNSDFKSFNTDENIKQLKQNRKHSCIVM